MPESARAQSFFEQLFGAPAPPPRVIQIPAMRPHTRLPQSSRDDGDEGARSDGTSGATYRTICVRLCDGYYFPISFATTRKHFQADQQKCSASCGNAQLFVYRNPGAGVEDAADLSGKAYSALPTAFTFRKKVVEGCSCQPQPWTEAAAERHKAYAAAASPAALSTVAASNKLSDAATLPADTSAPIVAASASPEQVKAVSADAAEPKSPAPRAKRAAAAVVRRDPAVPRAVLAAPKPTPGASFPFASMGLGGPTSYTWPGDPVRR